MADDASLIRPTRAIERVKFFSKGEEYYLSLDPYDETEEEHDEDGNVIKAEIVEAYAILKPAAPQKPV